MRHTNSSERNAIQLTCWGLEKYLLIGLQSHSGAFAKCHEAAQLVAEKPSQTLRA
jgi:hypothetical protein